MTEVELGGSLCVRAWGMDRLRALGARLEIPATHQRYARLAVEPEATDTTVAEIHPAPRG